MIPIDSYHDASLGVVGASRRSSMSPFLTATRQSAAWPVIDTSHDTAPAGS